jgi:hypothetical protein
MAQEESAGFPAGGLTWSTRQVCNVPTPHLAADCTGRKGTACGSRFPRAPLRERREPLIWLRWR